MTIQQQTLAEIWQSINERERNQRPSPNLIIMSPHTLQQLARFSILVGEEHAHDWPPGQLDRAREWLRRKKMRKSWMARKHRRGW